MTDPSSLAGKTALVTGGSRGIGAGIAIQLAKKGISRLAITYVGNQAAAEATLATIRSLGVSKAVSIQADVLDAEIGTKLMDAVLRELDTRTLDIVVNNAAIVSLDLIKPFAETTAQTFNAVMQGNAFAAMNIIAAALPHLPPRGGRVINISSIASKLPNDDPMFAYGASKAALDSITRSFAASLAVKTLATFNSVSVGGTATDGVVEAVKAYPHLLDKALADFTTEKRLAEVEEIAYVVAFLASDEARWINGANVPVNGGHRELLALQG